MRCPTLNELPRPSLDKTGWPWTEECEQLPATMPNSEPWPRLSIVTPSYNQAQFLEETIRSVLLQGYPNLEYIIIDGGSDDSSVEIIRRYEPWLTCWVSENDDGQAYAINKGFRRATGSILAWLNSDDIFLPGAFASTAHYLAKHEKVALVYGNQWVLDSKSHLLSRFVAPPFDLRELLFQYKFIPQQTVFFRRQAFEEVGGLDESMFYTMDYDLWLRLGHRHAVRKLNRFLGAYRKHQCSKTVQGAHKNRYEIIKALRKLFSDTGLKEDIKWLEPYAYANVYLELALHHLQFGHPDQAKTFANKAFQHAPDLLERQQDRFLRLLVRYVPTSLPMSEAEMFLSKAISVLPPGVCDANLLKRKAMNRLLIIYADRNGSARTKFSRRQRWSAVAYAFLKDRRWALNRQVLPALLTLIVGPACIKKYIQVRDNLSRESLILSELEYKEHS